MDDISRPSWDEYFMTLAKQVATRATCHRAHVGCVIVSKDNRVLVTGYNGSISGSNHCGDDNHVLLDNHCVRVNHAEANAIAQAAANGIAVKDSTAYLTMRPCLTCAKLLAGSGVNKIIYDGDYKVESDKVFDEVLFTYDRRIRIKSFRKMILNV